MMSRKNWGDPGCSRPESVGNNSSRLSALAQPQRRRTTPKPHRLNGAESRRPGALPMATPIQLVLLRCRRERLAAAWQSRVVALLDKIIGIVFANRRRFKTKQPRIARKTEPSMMDLVLVKFAAAISICLISGPRKSAATSDQPLLDCHSPLCGVVGLVQVLRARRDRHLISNVRAGSGDRLQVDLHPEALPRL